ncbi:MAG TPA: S-layer homology domain-containing protein [Thermoanaerobaculia bacterium]|jgi:hypothetical protein
MTRSVRTGLCVAAFLSLFATSLRAQQKAGVPDPRAYGIQHWTIDRIGAPEFTPENNRTDYESNGPVLYSNGGAGTFHASAHIPKGALLTFFDLDYCDQVTGSTVEAWLYTSPHNLTASSTNLSHLISTTQITCTSAFEDLTSQKITFNPNTDDLFVEVETHGGDISSSFSGVSIFYQLQVSPAPATATFADVPTNHPYFRFIEALASSGITKGCGAGPIFCPNQTITRQEVATWMAKALGLDWQ